MITELKKLSSAKTTFNNRKTSDLSNRLFFLLYNKCFGVKNTTFNKVYSSSKIDLRASLTQLQSLEKLEKPFATIAQISFAFFRPSHQQTPTKELVLY